MYAYLLQDSVTLTGTANTLTLTQSHAEWLALTGFQDVVALIEITDFTSAAGLTFKLETSPSEDESFFGTMAQQAISSTGVFAIIVPAATAPTPLAKWLRWTVIAQNPVPWSITLRAVLSLNAVERSFLAVRGDAHLAPLAGA